MKKRKEKEIPESKQLCPEVINSEVVRWSAHAKYLILKKFLENKTFFWPIKPFLMPKPVVLYDIYGSS